MIIKDLGAVSAYAYAVEKGYTGTEEEYAELMASYATVAEEAAESAESASQSAESASASAQTATSKASEASTSATQASASATSASQSASTATTKASEASASASTAGTKASEASASATTASGKASEASASATSAQTAQGLAESARDDAIDAKTDAESARDLAQQYADSIDPDNIFSAYATDTASGAVATFTDGADDIPMKSVVVNIEPVQSGSGDPSPTNVRPISGWTGAHVVRTGVNVWDEEWEVGTISSTTGETVSDPSRVRSKNYIPCVPSSAYCFTKVNVSTNTDVRPFFYDASKNFISVGAWSSGNTVQNTPSNCHYMKFICATGYGTTYNHDISINYPATDYDYHPYTGQTYDISFPAEAGTVYGGTLDVTNGVLTVDRAMVDLGTLSWSSGFSGFISLSLKNVIANVSSNLDTPNIISSEYKTTPYANRPDKSISLIWHADPTYAHKNYIAVRDSTYSDATTFRQAMDGVQLCYELATPITYNLTPTEIKSLLGDNNVWADAGNIEVTYRADTAMYIDKKIAEVINALS